MTAQQQCELAYWLHLHRCTETTLVIGPALIHDDAQQRSEPQRHVHQWCANANTSRGHCPMNATWHRIHPPCGKDLHAPTNTNLAVQIRLAPNRVVLDPTHRHRRMATPHQIGPLRSRPTESWWGYPNAPFSDPPLRRWSDRALPPCVKLHQVLALRRRGGSKKIHYHLAPIARPSYTRLHSRGLTRDIARPLEEVRSQSCRGRYETRRFHWCQIQVPAPARRRSPVRRDPEGTRSTSRPVRE